MLGGGYPTRSFLEASPVFEICHPLLLGLNTEPKTLNPKL